MKVVKGGAAVLVCPSPAAILHCLHHEGGVVAASITGGIDPANPPSRRPYRENLIIKTAEGKQEMRRTGYGQRGSNERKWNAAEPPATRPIREGAPTPFFTLW